MNRYKVLRPFTDYGMHHSVGSIIIDTSIISNLPVKLWEGVLVRIDDSGKEYPVEKPKPTTTVKAKPTPASTVATPKTTPAATKTVTKVTK